MAATRTDNPALCIKFWLPVFIWMGVIFYLSSVPAKDIPLLFPFQDVLTHFVIYAILAYFFSRAIKNTYSGLALKNILYLTIIFGFSYGVSDEFHQLFVPGRSASGFDLFINSLGSFAGGLFCR